MLFSVAPEFMFLFNLKLALDSFETIALVVHDVMCHSFPSVGLSCLVCEMRGWTILPALASKWPCPPCSSLRFALYLFSAVWGGILLFLCYSVRLGLIFQHLFFCGHAVWTRSVDTQLHRSLRLTFNQRPSTTLGAVVQYGTRVGVGSISLSASVFRASAGSTNRTWVGGGGGAPSSHCVIVCALGLCRGPHLSRHSDFGMCMIPSS